MTRIIIAPNRYVQGPGVLGEIGRHIGHLGRKAFFIGGPTAISIVEEKVEGMIKDDLFQVELVSFVGECTRANAEGLAKRASEFGADIIIGVGGGRAIDTAKAVSHELGLHLVVAPTIASNDAPCSALSVQYKENHLLDRFLILRRSPDVVLVDSEIIVQAPTRYFVAGMGDALATWFEAFTCTKSSASNLPGGLSTEAALTLARLCYETLINFGVHAKLAVDRDVLTPAVERVIEANILLSGIGFDRDLRRRTEFMKGYTSWRARRTPCTESWWRLVLSRNWSWRITARRISLRFWTFVSPLVCPSPWGSWG